MYFNVLAVMKWNANSRIGRFFWNIYWARTWFLKASLLRFPSTMSLDWFTAAAAAQIINSEGRSPETSYWTPAAVLTEERRSLPGSITHVWLCERTNRSSSPVNDRGLHRVSADRRPATPQHVSDSMIYSEAFELTCVLYSGVFLLLLLLRLHPLFTQEVCYF